MLGKGWVGRLGCGLGICGLLKSRFFAWQLTELTELTELTKLTKLTKSAESVQKTYFSINRVPISKIKK